MSAGLPSPAGPVEPRSLADLRAIVGRDLGPTGWYAVTQERIARFAESTEDFQWIHIDEERAAATPIGTTIAHGLYTLSLGPKFTMELISFAGFASAINYGYERVRFPAPLTRGSRLRMRVEIRDVLEVEGGAQVGVLQTFESDSAPKPVCVATALVRFYEAA